MSAAGASTSFTALLGERAATLGDVAALRVKHRGLWREVSWRELHEQVRAMALGLEEHGLRKGDTLVLRAENGPRWIVIDLAVQALGARCLPLSPQAPMPVGLARYAPRLAVSGSEEDGHELLEALIPAKTELIVLEVVDKERAALEDAKLTPVDRVLAAGREAAERDPGRFERMLGARDREEEVALTLVPHGPEREPATAQSAGTLLDAATASASWLGLGAGDRTLCVLPLSELSVRTVDVYAPLVAGAQICIPEGPGTVRGDLAEISPTVLSLSPRALEMLCNESELRAEGSKRLNRAVIRWARGRLERDLGPAQAERTLAGSRRRSLADVVVGRPAMRQIGFRHVRRVIAVGGAVPRSVARFFWSFGVPVLEAYGPPGLGGVGLVQAPLGEPRTMSVWLPGARAEAADGVLRVGAPTATGELEWIGTDQAAEQVEGGVRLRGEVGATIDGEGASLYPQEMEDRIRESRYVKNALVTEPDAGAGIGVHVEIDFDPTAAWAHRRDLPFTTYATLVRLPETRELIVAELAAALGASSGGSTPRLLGIFDRPLSADAGELTPLMTPDREVAAERLRSDGPESGVEQETVH